MDVFEFATPIKSKGREYMLTTKNIPATHKLIMTLQLAENIVNTQEIFYSINLSYEELSLKVKTWHEEKVKALQDLIRLSQETEKSSDLEVKYKLGLAFFNKGMLKEAILELKRALSMANEKASILNSLGLVLALDDRLSESIVILQQAKDLKPTYPDIHNNLGMAYLRVGNYPEAQASFEQALKLNPSYAQASFNLALTLVTQLAFKAEAKQNKSILSKIDQHMAMAIEFDKDFNNEPYRLAKKYLSDNQFAEAREALEEARNLLVWRKRNEDYYEFYLRLKYSEKGVTQKATEQYIAKIEEVLKKYPAYEDIHNDLGIAYLIQCKFLFNKAINEFNQALDINPKYEQAIRNIKLVENEGKGFILLIRAMLNK